MCSTGRIPVGLALRRRGYALVPEAATDVIAVEQARGVDEPWDSDDFVDKIVLLQRQRQAQVPAGEVAVQIFDRSPLCTLALARYLQRPVTQLLVQEVARVVEEHAVRGAKPARRYFLAGADEDESVEIPELVHRVLRQVLEAMKAGKAVTVVPQNKLLTTQHAAELLGVSRPTVVKLIAEGKLPAETPGKRRRMVKLTDQQEFWSSLLYRGLSTVVADDPSQTPTRTRKGLLSQPTPTGRHSSPMSEPAEAGTWSAKLSSPDVLNYVGRHARDL